MKVTQLKSDGKLLKNIELNTVLTAIGSGEYNREVCLLRGLLNNVMPGGRNVRADKIPILMFAAMFRKKGNSLNFTAYNGIVLVQVNNLADSGEVAKIKKLASEAPQTLAAFTGSSGKSVKILVSFTLPDGSLPQTKELAEFFHASAFQRAVNYYRAQLQCDI